MAPAQADSTVQRFQAEGPTVKKWGGWILIAVGVRFIVLAIFADFVAEQFPV